MNLTLILLMALDELTTIQLFNPLLENNSPRLSDSSDRSLRAHWPIKSNIQLPCRAKARNVVTRLRVEDRSYNHINNYIVNCYFLDRIKGLYGWPRGIFHSPSRKNLWEKTVRDARISRGSQNLRGLGAITTNWIKHLSQKQDMCATVNREWIPLVADSSWRHILN